MIKQNTLQCDTVVPTVLFCGTNKLFVNESCFIQTSDYIVNVKLHTLNGK